MASNGEGDEILRIPGSPEDVMNMVIPWSRAYGIVELETALSLA